MQKLFKGRWRSSYRALKEAAIKPRTPFKNQHSKCKHVHSGSIWTSYFSFSDAVVRIIKEIWCSYLLAYMLRRESICLPCRFPGCRKYKYVRWMEEILHQLGSPEYCNYWGVYAIVGGGARFPPSTILIYIYVLYHIDRFLITHDLTHGPCKWTPRIYTHNYSSGSQCTPHDTKTKP